MIPDKYIKMLYGLLAKAGEKQNKAAIVCRITAGRTDHISLMTMQEVMDMKEYLESLIREKDKEKVRFISTLTGLCYGIHKVAPHLGMINNGKVDYNKLNEKVQFRVHKKNLNGCSKEDIKIMIIYFKLLIKNYGNH